MALFYGGSERKVMAMARHELDLFMNVDYEAFQAVLKKTPTARSWYKEFPWAYPNELSGRYFGFNLGRKTVFTNKDEIKQTRWTQVSYIAQGSMYVLNPVCRVSDTFHDFIATHRDLGRSETAKLARDYLQKLGLPEQVMSVYPHQTHVKNEATSTDPSISHISIQFITS